MTKIEDEKVQYVLKQRADKFSKTELFLEKGETVEVIFFYLSHEKYAIETSYVKEVYSLKEITPLPGVPSFVVGLMNCRRKIISVIDLKVFFELSRSIEYKNKKVIILELHDMSFAIITDGIEGVHSIPVKGIQDTLPTLSGVRQEFLKGITLEGVIVLDGERFLKDSRILVKEEV